MIQVSNEIIEETCDIIPNRYCQKINIMIPYIDFEENCREITNAVCEMQRNNPRIENVKRMVKKCTNKSKQEDGK